MKPFRIAVVLMALLVLPLFATQALAADFSAGVVDVPKSLVSAFTVNKPVIGFTIPAHGGVKLDRVVLKSYIDSYNATKMIELWRENHATPGFQDDEDIRIAWYTTSGGDFDIMDTIIMSPNYTLSGTTLDTFFVTLDINEGVVAASPQLYDGTCLEVVMEVGRIRMANGDRNNNHVHNSGWNPAATESPWFYAGQMKLCFDCLGPQFDLHFCIAANTCSTEAYYHVQPYVRVPMVDQEDSIRICATNIDSDIDTTEGIHVIGYVHLLGYVSSKHMFGVDDITLKWNDNQGEAGDSCQDDYCDDDYSTLFQIPDSRNVGGFNGVDADTGHWAVCAWAEDTLGNRDTICLAHEDLPLRIDTQKPKIDEITWEFVNDLNGDGKIGLGDCIMIVATGYSNPILPIKECVKMRVDTSWMAGNSPTYPDGEWAELSDTLQENNRIFRRVFCMTTPVAIDSNNGCPVNFLVEAWDNACNYDTSRGKICADMDLDPPSVIVTYEWQADFDTAWACMSLGDSVKIRADVGGADIVSVTAMMDSMGIDKDMHHALPLPNISGGWYELHWKITEPPIHYGKDDDNTQPPPRDNVYLAFVTACDDAHNCVTAYDDLNKVMDTRRPRPIGFFCPDSVPCALVAKPLPGGVIQLMWDTACDENDAHAFYVWASYNGGPFDSIGYTDEAEQNPLAPYWSWHSEPLLTGWWSFKIKTEDNCSNVGDFSCEVGTIADSTPPNACIVFPDSGSIYGDPFAVKARSEDQDINKVCLWYRLRHDLNDPPTGEAGQWAPCLSAPCMSRPGDGLVFLDTVACIHDYVGWVELLPVSGDVIGNWQDTTRAYAEACIDDSLQNLVDGHFLFYWDTTRAVVRVVSVNDTISPQTLCGYNVNPDIMNQVIINVDGAEPTDLFTIDVKAIKKWKSSYRVDYRNNVTMPCTIMVSVDNWDAGTQHLYVRVTNEANGKECVPYPLAIELCVPWQTTPCVTIVAPVEWQRIPCSKTDKTCVPVWAEITPGCPESLLTQVKFFYSKNAPGPPWNLIEEVLEPDTVWVLGHPKLYWKTCWNNLGLVQDGDTVYFMAEGFNQFHISGTSKMVKVFVDCTAPTVKLRIEDVITTCSGTPKVAGEIILKALVVDTLVDITELNFWYKLHSDPDIPAYWHKLCDSERGWWWGKWEEFEPWSENVWACEYETEDLPNQTWIDIRVSVEDQAGNVWLDSDEDGKFDDSTFMVAVAAEAGITVFVDNEAPQPAISMVADTAAKIYNVNPSTLLGGSGEAYVKAGDDIYSEISVLPSEDTCEVMKVEWFLCLPVEGDDMPIVPSPGQGGKVIPHVPYQGDNCEDPIELTLPRDLDFSDTNHTCGRYNDYQGTCLAPFDSSDDIIYKLNITTNVVLKIKWRTYNMWKSGMALFSQCPHHGGPVTSSGPDLVGYGGGCLYHSVGIHPDEWHYLKDGCSRHLYLEPGTYYLMLDSWRGCRQPGDLASGQSAADLQEGNFELEITGEAIGCYHVGTSNDPYHFPVNFNPVKDGLIPAYELEDHWWHGNIQAVLYDSLGNYKTDDVGLYILDVTASQAVIVNPLNDGYVSGDVTLQSRSLNDYEICKVCYEYKPEGDSVWYPINDGYPNACTTERKYGSFWQTWHTLNTVPDGAYYLRAVATDCSNNVDTLPPTIKVTVSNGLPVVTLEDPRICSRECPDDTVDTLGYVGGTVPLYATVSWSTPEDSIPVGYVAFYYKDIFQYPDEWKYIGTDYFPTDGKYSVEWCTPSDGRYHVKAVAVTYSWKSGESEWMVISVDNTVPFSQIISIMGEDHLDYGVDITKGDVIPIEIVAKDWSSLEGWTRCYNSGLTKISVCIAKCDTSVIQRSSPSDGDSTEITKCFEVDSVYDGTHVVLWNTSGLEYEGCEGCYYIYVKAYDCLGNEGISYPVRVYVRDNTAPVTTIGGFDGNYVYGYSSERIKTLLFEYADSGSTNWIPIGWSDTLRIRSYAEYWAENCGYYLYKTSWNPASLANGIYQVRVISHDTCSNQNDSLAPVAYFTVEDGTITPYNPDVLGALSFEKNWCVGGMHGIVNQTSTEGAPVVFARYGSTYECVDMQAHLQNTNEYAGSFFAGDIEYGGPAKFFSSVTVPGNDEVGPAYVTYLNQGSFDVVQVKRDLGTHGTYQQGCVDVTIPAGAVGGTFTYDRYIWVSPTTMPWVPVTQPELKPIGDNNGYATYVAFTDCYYCCGWFKSQFGGEQGDISQSPSSGYDDCCFNPGRYAKIKMCYDSTVTTDKEHLAVMWWDCQDGKFKFDNIALDIQGVEGFNTTNHTVEFATTCLSGPFAVVELIERPCEGTIVVSLREQDIMPYSNGYTNTTPVFTGFITDNHPQGKAWIKQSTINFKLDLYHSGELITIYDSTGWAKGFGGCTYAGYDATSGIFKACWTGIVWPYVAGDLLDPGPHMATLTAQNKNVQTCTDTAQFFVDNTPPTVVFEEKCIGGPNPGFDVYIIDRESGVNKNLIYVDFGSSYTLTSGQLASMWVNDSLLHVTLPVQKLTSSGEYEVRVYDGSGGSTYGPVDMVGNRATRFWYRYRVDLDKPVIALLKPSYRFRRPVLFSLYDYAGGCGIWKIMIDECINSPTGYTCTPAPAESVVYDYQTAILRYYPPASGAWIQVTVKDSAHNTTFLDSVYCVEDYDPPMVSFVPGYNGKYVGSNPTIKFVVTDGVAGVNWETVNALITGCSNSCTYPWTEVLNHMQNDTVTLSCPLACSDGSNFTIYVYSDYTYSKGPADKGDNYIKSAQTWTYWVDASGPSITLKTPSDSLCNRPLLFEIKDAYSGFDTVYVYQDSSLVPAGTVFTRDPHIPNYWRYTPTAGKTRLDITAVDKLGNTTWYGMKIKSDCTPPLASFGAEFVACYNPTVEITLTDDVSGVDWTKVYVDLWRYSDRIQTFGPDLLVREGNTLTVTGDGDWLGLTDGSGMNVYVYSAKTPATSYTKGPLDSAGNYQTSTSWFSKTYTADCSGPSVTWVWPSPTAIDSCSATLTFKIIDTYSGVDGIVMTEDGAVVPPTAYSYDPLTWILTYTPSAGKHKVVITATDKLGNVNTYTFYRKDDCLPPGLKFVGEYVTKNPTVKIVVKDDKVGIDWNTVNVDLYQRDYPYKQCTFTAADIANFNMRHGDTVIVSCTMDLTDVQTLIAYVYAEKTSGTGTSPSYGRGPADLSSNYMPKWQECIYQVDAGLPQFSPSCGSIDRSQRPIKICIIDGKSGVDWSSLEFYAESETLCFGSECQDTSVTVNTTEGCIYYEAGAGSKHVEIRIKDQAGNQSICTFETEEENLFFTNPHNYPNPFDPRELSTYIDLGLSKSAYVTVKIYDFAGEFVRELQRNEFTGISVPILWDGKTDDGTEVANGTYLCYIHARDDDSGKIETAVIKITVLKKDK